MLGDGVISPVVAYLGDGLVGSTIALTQDGRGLYDTETFVRESSHTIAGKYFKYPFRSPSDPSREHEMFWTADNDYGLSVRLKRVDPQSRPDRVVVSRSLYN